MSYLNLDDMKQNILKIINIDKLNQYLDIINRLVNIINNDTFNLKLKKKKKHFPLICDYDLIYFKNDIIYIKHKNSTKENSYLNTPYSFTLSTLSIDEHKQNLIRGLNNSRFILELYKTQVDIEYQSCINNTLTYEMYVNFRRLIQYDYSDGYSEFCLEKTREFNKQTGIIYDQVYYINLCPPFAIYENKIANCYVLAYKDNKWNIFFEYTKYFSTLGDRPGLDKQIHEFNNNNHVTPNNLFNIIRNMASIITDYTITDHTGKKTIVTLENIGDPPSVKYC